MFPMNRHARLVQKLCGSAFAFAVLLAPLGLWGQAAPSFLYVTNNVISNVSIYQINPGTGALTLVGATQAGTGSAAIAVTPDQRFLYVNNLPGARISGFSVNAVTGLLTPIPGSPFPAGRPSER